MQRVLFFRVIGASLSFKGQFLIDQGSKQSLLVVERFWLLAKYLEIVLTVGGYILDLNVRGLHLQIFTADCISDIHLFLRDM